VPGPVLLRVDEPRLAHRDLRRRRLDELPGHLHPARLV
jgi:hypothetical protein